MKFYHLVGALFVLWTILYLRATATPSGFAPGAAFGARPLSPGSVRWSPQTSIIPGAIGIG